MRPSLTPILEIAHAHSVGTLIRKGRIFGARLRRFATPQVVMTTGILFLILNGLLILHSVLANRWWATNTDVAVYVRAATLLRQGHSPYDLAASNLGGLGFYLYPPAFAMAFVPPLVLLGPWLTRLLWFAFSGGAFGISVVMLLRLLVPRLAWSWIWLALGLLSFAHLVHSDLYYGEANALILLLFTLGLVALAKGQSGRVGVWWGLACAVKPFVIVLALYLLWRRQWRAVRWLLITTILTVGVPFLLIGGSRGPIAGLREYSNIAATYVANQTNNLALHGLIGRLFTSTPGAAPWLLLPWIVPLIDAVAAGFFAFLSIRAFGGMSSFSRERSPATRSADEVRLVLECSLVLTIGLTLGPVTEPDYLLLLLPGFVAVLCMAWRTRMTLQRTWNWAATVWILLFASLLAPTPGTTLAGPEVTHIVGTRPAGLAVLWTGRITVLLVVVIVASSRALYSERSSTIARSGKRPVSKRMVLGSSRKVAAH